MQHNNTHSIKNFWKKYFSLNTADIYMAIIFIMVLMGALAAIRMYDSIESMNKLTHLNYQQILTWQKIGQRIKFLIGTRENRVESDVLIRKIQQDLKVLLQHSEELNQSVKQVSNESKGIFGFFSFIKLNQAYLQNVTADPELKSRAIEVRDAPLSVVRSNFDYWPVLITNAIVSDRYIIPLYKHSELLAEMREQQLKTLYWENSGIITVSLLGIFLIWFGFLRPTFRKLSDARADTAFILDNAPGFICSYSPQGIFTSANQSYLNLVGAESVEVLKNKHMSEFVGPENWQKIKNHVARASSGEKIEFDVELTLRGKKRALLVSYRPKLASDGSVISIVAMIMDISERYKAQQALRLSEENLRITLNSIADAVISTDITGKIVNMNPQACRLTGWQYTEAINKQFYDVFHIVDYQTKVVLTPSLLKKQDWQKIQSKELLLIAKNKQQFRIAQSISSIKNAQGKTLGMVIVFRDMTEEYVLNQKLAQSEKLQSIGKLAGGIAHDFNNILAGIQGTLDVLFQNKDLKCINDENKTQGYIDRLIQRGSGLTEKLTAFARIKEETFKAVNINALMADILAMVQNTTDKRIKFHYQNNAQNSWVFGSESTLQSALLNILLNAIDAIENSGAIQVSIQNTVKNTQLKGIVLGETRANISYLHISVKDTGSGMDKKTIKQIFDPFFTTKSSGKGVGLGLSATYGTIQDHQGLIALESTKNKGTTFKILLPIFKGEPLLDDKKASSKSLIARDEEKTILFADDESTIRKAVKEYFQNFNYTVVLANNGQQCVDIFSHNHNKIDAVVLDINMPIKNGMDVIKDILKIDKNVKIFVSTGYPGEESELVKLQDKVIKVLEKPYRLSQLIQELDRVLKN